MLGVHEEEFRVDDSDYEYDAPTFFDFTSPELPQETEEAERWFRSASGYPPSHEFLDGEISTCNVVDCQNKDALNDNADVTTVSLDSTSNRLWQKTSNPKSQLRPYLPKSSTLMKPTASHLAKLYRPDHDQSTRYIGRSIKVALQDRITKSKQFNCNAPPVNRKSMAGPSLIHGRGSAPSEV